MFNWFKEQQPVPSPRGTGELTDEEAQTIVYAFIDHMAAHSPIVGDASTLPHPKEAIRRAFTKHLQHYETMRSISAATFRQMGYHETVEQLQAMSVRIDDWHDIDPEDKEAVTRLNRIQAPPPDWSMPLIAKYFGRAVGR